MNTEQRMAAIAEAEQAYAQAIDTHYKQAVHEAMKEYLLADQKRTAHISISGEQNSDDEGGSYLYVGNWATPTAEYENDGSGNLDMLYESDSPFYTYGDSDDYTTWKEDENLKTLWNQIGRVLGKSDWVERSLGTYFEFQFELENGELVVTGS